MSDMINMTWTDNDGNIFIIGELVKDEDKYLFRYKLDNLKKALNHGFEPIVSFPQINATYESENLFPAFLSRLPDKRRRDIHEILEGYGLDAYEPFEILKVGGGRLPTDRYGFTKEAFLQ